MAKAKVSIQQIIYFHLFYEIPLTRYTIIGHALIYKYKWPAFLYHHEGPAQFVRDVSMIRYHIRGSEFQKRFCLRRCSILDRWTSTLLEVMRSMKLSVQWVTIITVAVHFKDIERGRKLFWKANQATSATFKLYFSLSITYKSLIPPTTPFFTYPSKATVPDPVPWQKYNSFSIEQMKIFIELMLDNCNLFIFN